MVYGIHPPRDQNVKTAPVPASLRKVGLLASA